MNPEDQNKAIAEACGHKYHKPTEEEIRSGSYYQYEPDYVRCLNLMHSVEEAMFSKGGLQCAEYITVLSKLCYAGTNHATWFLAHATASQRAEAFLRTLGLWKESP